MKLNNYLKEIAKERLIDVFEILEAQNEESGQTYEELQEIWRLYIDESQEYWEEVYNLSEKEQETLSDEAWEILRKIERPVYNKINSDDFVFIYLSGATKIKLTNKNIQTIINAIKTA